jgi:hypothetical protein
LISIAGGLYVVTQLFKRLFPQTRTADYLTGWDNATHWWRAHLLPEGLFPLSPRHMAEGASLETSAVMVPALYRWGFVQEAQQVVNSLLRHQHAEGHWHESVWLTGHSLNAVMVDMTHSLHQGKSFKSAMERSLVNGCDWLSQHIQANGSFSSQAVAQINTWPLPPNRTADASVLLSVLPPLAWAAKVMHRPQYQLAVERALRHYLLDNPLSFSSFSLYYAQTLLALCDLGQAQHVDKRLLALPLTRSGEIPAFDDGPTISVAAQFLWSQLYYRLGHPAMGKHLLARGLRHQQGGSGAFALCAKGAGIPGHLSSLTPVMAIGFYMQAVAQHLDAQREAMAPLLPTGPLPAEDPRRQWLNAQVLPTAGNIVEIMSGKGRLVSTLQANTGHTASMASSAGLQWHVVDSAASVLQSLPVSMHPRHGHWQALPYQDGTIKAIVAHDSLSNSVYIPGALREAGRVLAPDGQLMLIERPLQVNNGTVSPWQTDLNATRLSDLLTQSGFYLTTPVNTLEDGSLAICAKRP